MTALTVDELISWNDDTSKRWERLLAANLQVLSLPCDIRETRSVAELLQHIIAVELRYAERLHDQPQTSYEEIPFHSVEAIYGTHERAIHMLRSLKDRDSSFWDGAIELTTRSAGTLKVVRRGILVHLLMHSIRHYAQLATLVRHHGVSPDWQMDYLFMQLVS